MGERKQMPMPQNRLSYYLPFLSFMLLLLTNAYAQQPSTLFEIDAGASPETNSSLQHYLCGEGTRKLVSNTTLQLSGGVHHLQEGPFCLLQNLENLIIHGQQTHPRTIIYCQSETEMRRGIAFFNISSLHLSHLQIINCGREVPTGLPGHVNSTFAYLGPLQKAVMIITHSTNTTVEGVSIDKCLGFGMLFINPLGQTVTREVSINNTSSYSLSECKELLERRDMLCSGSGAAFIFSDTDITEELVKIWSNYAASLSIISSSFYNNTNFIPTHPLADGYLNIVATGIASKRILLTGGISLCVWMSQRSYLVDVKLINTVILSNTGNIVGFTLIHYNTIRMSKTMLDGVVISDNKIIGILGRGSGLMVIVNLFLDSLSSFPQFQEDIYDLVEIAHSNFSHNSAYYNGGGILLYMTSQNISDVRIVIRNTYFIENVAVFGPALWAFQFQSLINNRGMYIYLENIVALGNTIPQANILNISPENIGAFHIAHIFNITLVGTEGKGCLFRGNGVSVFLAVKTYMVLRGRIIFEENRGFRGGALSLIDNSVLFIHNGSNIRFTRNTAFREGGAIYINTLGSSPPTICAIQFFAEKQIRILRDELQLFNISVVFSNNSAVVAGNAIFGNPLYFCQLIPTTSIEHILYILNTNQTVIYEEVFDFRDSVGNELSEFNSVEDRVCICPSATFSSKQCAPHYKLNHSVIPGDSIILFLDPVDVAGAPVASLVYAFPRSANSSHPVSLDSHQDIRPLPGLSICSLVDFTIFAPEDITVYIDLFASIGRQKATVELNTTSCPPGFVLNSADGSDRLSCQCSDFIRLSMVSTCNMTHYTVVRPTNYWVGTRKEDDGHQIIQYVSTCPTDYCREDVTDIDLRVSDQLCTEGRTGTLCGACREGLSSVFGIAKCRKCSNGWLALLPLFALIGIVLVISGLLLDLTITHGLINGIFFYSYITMVNSNIFFQGNKSGFLFWFLSWINMDSGFPMCFYNGMTESAKLGLQYVFPTYSETSLIRTHLKRNPS